MDRETVRNLRAHAERVLQEMAAEHGLTVTVAGGSFTADSYTPRITFLEPGANEADFARKSIAVGLLPEDFGSRVMVNGAEFELVGINLRAHRYPILAKDTATGKTFKLSREPVLRGLGR